MAGKHGRSDTKQVDDSANIENDEASPHASESKYFPTVMLKKSDASQMLALVERRNSKQQRSRVHLQTSSILFSLDSELLGNVDYPKIRARKSYIQVLSRHGWGVVLTSTSGKEWQLFLVENSDMESSAMNPALYDDHRVHQAQRSPQVLTSNSIGAIASTDVYHTMLSEQCPSQFVVETDRKARLSMIRDFRYRRG
jgi:uncharacterized protein (DUF2235 family)